MSKTIALLCVLSMSSFIFAAEEEGRERPMPTGAQSMELNDTLKPLSYYVGVWTIEEDVAASEFTKAGKVRGKVMIRPALDGQALVGRMQGEGPEGRFEALHVLTPEKDNEISMYWADSKGNAHMDKNIKVEGKKLTVESKHMHGDKETTMRYSDKMVDNNRIDYTIEVKTDEGWKRVSTGTYTRAAEAGQPVKFHREKEAEKTR